MTAQLFAFPIPDTLDRLALQRAATTMRLDLDPAAPDNTLRTAVRNGLHEHLAAARAEHDDAPPACTLGQALNPGDFARLAGRDYTTLRTTATGYCTEAGCPANSDAVAQDAVLMLAMALRDGAGTWLPRRTDLTGVVIAWTEHASDGQVVRLISRDGLYAAALAEAARHNGCTHQPARPPDATDGAALR